MHSPRRPYLALILTALLPLLVLSPGQTGPRPSPAAAPLQPGCTVFYGFDGETALGGNNEDFINPLTNVWFIPASPGRYGRVYFGYDDYIPQGGLNDQGLFFDALALPYKAMPVASQRPHFPGGDLALYDEILASSANVAEAVANAGRWTRAAGEYAQFLFGDRFGDSVIIDGDTVLPKEGAFQVATNFRLVDNPNPPYPEERYATVARMLANSDHYTVELFRQALDAAHAEGDAPTLYSQVYELNTGLIHLYQYHDFEQEVTLNLADELAKGFHAATIASLFPKNAALEQWTLQQKYQWKADYEQLINDAIDPDSLSWMSGQYTLQPDSAAEPVRVYVDDHQLYLQLPNQLPTALYPASADTVFHHYFNGMDLTLTFQRDLLGQVSGAKGGFSFAAYDINVSYDLARVGSSPDAGRVVLLSAGLGLGLLLVGGVALGLVRRRRGVRVR